MKNKNKILKKIIFFIILGYAVVTFINQQRILKNYDSQVKTLKLEISEAKDRQDKLNNEKENINSLEYIEILAREKLGMYMPNEKVYVDNEN